MGDAGEGLVDNESRIQERMDELKAERDRAKKPRLKNPEQTRKLDSLNLARTQILNQLKGRLSGPRREQIQKALEDIDGQIAQIEAAIDRS